MACSPEHRPLKRQKLGPPDVYPQDAKQIEDELDDVSVKQGFTHRPQIADEYGSALNISFNPVKITHNFSNILKKKAESNQLPDTAKKKLQINFKDNFWPFIDRSDGSADIWFRDLAGSKSLSLLGKKVPVFKEKDDMFAKLYKYSVPFVRAIWFIKMTAAHQESKFAESKMKKRQQPDISLEWTQTLIKLLRDQYLATLAEACGSSAMGCSSSCGGSLQSGSGAPLRPPHASPHNQGSSSILLGNNSSPNYSTSSTSFTEALKPWKYCTHLAHFMYQEGLLDRQEFLESIVDLVIRYKSSDQDSVLRIVLSLVLQYIDEITQSEYLSRKISYYGAQKISQLCRDSASGSTGGNASGVNSASQQNSTNPLSSCFQEMLTCNLHRPVILMLSCVIQAVTLDCPCALVWNNAKDNKAVLWLVGSPLDSLPCAPSELPLPRRYNNHQIRNQLCIMEDHIRQRSQNSENRWSLDKTSANVTGSTINKVLSVLDALDRHCFDKVEPNNSLETLYSKIFVPTKDCTSVEVIQGTNGNAALPNSSTNGTSPNSNASAFSPHEESVVRTLCEWAVSVQRSGEHRALVVAHVLEKRQNELSASENELTDEKDSINSDHSSNGYVFQNLLLKFLDTQAPICDENALSLKSREFGNLVLLFSELIQQDVFSHDSYMCTLISRGDLSTGIPDMKQGDPFAVKKEDGKDNVDGDLHQLLQNITKGADAPDSPKDDVNTSLEEGSSAGSGVRSGDRSEGGKHRPPRHLIYAQHFPLPNDEAYSHECNQRYALLYGVGKARDDARHTVKKLTKDINKLFSKKFSLDIAEGGKVKKSSKLECNLESTFTRFCSLSYFDQHCITNAVSSQVLEMLSGCGSASSNYLPTHDHVAFLMDLMEVSLNIHGLLDFCSQVIKEIPDIEGQLAERQCLVGSYCPLLVLHVVGILRKYHCCLLGVLNALCCSSKSSPGYIDVFTQVDLRDPVTSPTIHASLSVFTAVLISRHCFTRSDFISHVVIQSMKAAWNQGNGNPEAEPGARLTCHLLLRIFRIVENPHPSQYASSSPQSISCMSQRSIRYSCDRNLLAVSQTSQHMGPITAVLTGMLIVSDAMSGQSKSQASISDILGTSDIGGGSNDSDMLGKGADKASLADFTRYVLRQFCSQEWVRECCLKCPEDLCSTEYLLDNILSPKQAQRLLHQICHPDSSSVYTDSSLDQRATIANILEDLDEWSLRVSWLDLHLMYQQLKDSPQELSLWLENVAQAVIQVFHLNPDQDLPPKSRIHKPQSINLVAPLIAKLPKVVQGEVLKVAGQALNLVNFGAYNAKSGSLQQNNMSSAISGGGGTNCSQQSPSGTFKAPHCPVSYPRPFLQLVLMCLEGQEDQLTELLESLKAQMMQCVILYKDEKCGFQDDPRNVQIMLEALKLRFALIGGLFDVVTSSFQTISEWSLLLVQLISVGVIDLTTNSELFNTVFDMLAALVHSTLAIDSSGETREENKRHYYALAKRIKRDIGDANNVSLRLVRQLIPLPKLHAEIITLEPWGSITDTKGNRLTDFDKDKKHGLQAAEKQKLSPWDLLDGQRNPAPLSWVWYGATKLERKPFKYDESFRLLRRHQHVITKPLSYFHEPPPLPPEDLDMMSDKQHELQPLREEVKAPDTPSDQSPRGMSKRGVKNTRNRKRQTRQVTAMAGIPTQPTVQPVGYQSQVLAGPAQGQWHGNFGQQQPQQQQFFTQQLPPAATRFPATLYNSRIAIKQYLDHRHPGGNPSIMAGQANTQTYPNISQMNHIPQQPQPSSLIRPSMPRPMYASNSGMQGSVPPPMPGQSGQMFANPNQGGSAMGQYNTFQQGPMGGAQMMPQGPSAAGMMGQNYQGGYRGNPAMMNMRSQQQAQTQQTGAGPYLGQGQMMQRSQFMGGTSGGMGMMNSSQPYSRAGMQSLGPGTGPGNQPMAGQGMGPGGGGMMQRMMMSSSGGQNASSASQGLSQMQRGMQPQQGAQAQQSTQQQMMNSMGYPQPPPY